MKKTILQRILKKENKGELNAEDGSAEREEQRRSERVRNYSGVAGGSWIRRRGNCRTQALTIGRIRTSAMNAAGKSGQTNPYNVFSPRSPRRITGSSKTLDMPDLESIIREFEKGFLSPSKHEARAAETGKQSSNFVKKIVAAFEVKYKACNEEGASSSPDTSCGGGARRRSLLSLDSPSEKLHSAMDGDELGEDRSRIEEEGTKGAEENRESRRSATFSTGSSKDLKNEASENSSDIYLSSLNLERRGSKDSISDCSSVFFKFDEEESLEGRGRSKVESLDDTVIVEGELDLTLPNPEQAEFPKTSNDEFSKKGEEEEEEGSKEGRQMVSRNDKTPKIVGAFLKRPIEVEDTSIDWIPITGKKLPRKKSLKKLLYSLTGKRLEKKRNLFSSERNLNEGEYQDSGYDERSCSSSSLTSLASVTDVLSKAQREDSWLDSGRRITFKTFKSKSLEGKEEDATFCDSCRFQGEEKKKRLILTEVSRESLRLDLGPSYPPLSLITQITLKPKTTSSSPSSPSLVKGTNLARLPKHPHLSKIRKHPFVSLTKMDNSQEFCSSQQLSVYRSSGQHSSVIIKNDMYEVEIRRNTEDIDPAANSSRHSSSSAATHYDVPRKFLSKSETEIWAKCQCTEREEPIYDVPKLQNIERSRSSDYEDVLSSKRRNAVAEDAHYAILDNDKSCPNDETRCDMRLKENSV